ncbi:MAG: hypothetical protein RR515_00080 [Clostridium sp.]
MASKKNKSLNQSTQEESSVSSSVSSSPEAPAYGVSITSISSTNKWSKENPSKVNSFDD